MDFGAICECVCVYEKWHQWRCKSLSMAFDAAGIARADIPLAKPPIPLPTPFQIYNTKYEKIIKWKYGSGVEMYIEFC